MLTPETLVEVLRREKGNLLTTDELFRAVCSLNHEWGAGLTMHEFLPVVAKAVTSRLIEIHYDERRRTNLFGLEKRS